MRAVIIHVLCEGQTEQGFVEEVLKPYLIEQGVSSVKSVLVTTNKKKNACGGLVAYQHAFDDLSILMKSNRDGEYEKHVFTTMFGENGAFPPTRGKRVRDATLLSIFQFFTFAARI